jgi:hypothetical protein
LGDADPIKFRRFSTSGDWLDNAATTVTSDSSFYDSHALGVTQDGGPILVWSSWSKASLLAALFDVNGEQSASMTVRSTGRVYDTFRERHMKIQSVGSDFLIPFFEPDGGSFRFNAYARYSASGERVGSTTGTNFDSSTLVQSSGIQWSTKNGDLYLNSVLMK